MCSEKLEELDISWCRGIPSSALGLLVDSCPTLKKVTIFGCSQVSGLRSFCGCGSTTCSALSMKYGVGYPARRCV